MSDELSLSVSRRAGQWSRLLYVGRLAPRSQGVVRVATAMSLSLAAAIPTRLVSSLAAAEAEPRGGVQASGVPLTRRDWTWTLPELPDLAEEITPVAATSRGDCVVAGLIPRFLLFNQVPGIDGTCFVFNDRWPSGFPL